MTKTEKAYDSWVRPLLSMILFILLAISGLCIYYRWFDHAQTTEMITSHIWGTRGSEVVDHGPFVEGDHIFLSRTYCQHDAPVSGHRTLIVGEKTMVTMPDVGVFASKECPFKSNREIAVPPGETGKFHYCTSYDFYVNPLQGLQTVTYPCEAFEILPKPVN